MGQIYLELEKVLQIKWKDLFLRVKGKQRELDLDKWVFPIRGQSGNETVFKIEMHFEENKF